MQSAESIETPAIISRAEAISLGLKHYFTGLPCKRGHISERSVRLMDCGECRREKGRAKYAENRESEVERQRKYRETHNRNPEHDRRYRQRNKEKLAEYRRNKYINNIDYYRNNSAKRRAKCSDMTEFDRFVVMEAYAACARRKVISGYDWHVDHMIPLAKGGNHEWSNIQAIPASLNRFKHDRMIYTKPLEWINAL